MLGVVSHGSTINHPLGDEDHSVEQTEEGFRWTVRFLPCASLLILGTTVFNGLEPTKAEADLRVDEVRLAEWARRKPKP